MTRTILNRFSGAVIWKGKAKTVKDALHAAIAAKVDLSRANLSRANLSGADLSPEALVTSELWRDYITQVVPALLVAGGKALDSFAPHFDCHSWDNCPIAYAFNAKGIEDVPILLKARAYEFVRLFDARLISWPLPTAEQMDAAWAVKQAEFKKAKS